MKKALLKRQENKCAICKIDISLVATRDLCLDHDHKFGHIRGVLCRNCNAIEGKIRTLCVRGKRTSTPLEYLKRLLEYLEHYKVPGPDAVYHPQHKTEDEKREVRNKKARVARARAKALKNVGGM